MKKISLFLLFFVISNCGYQPIYINKNLSNIEFNKINYKGDNDINKKIINSLSIKINEFDDNLNNLTLNSSFGVTETSKNTKGQVESYRSEVSVNVIISNKNNIILDKMFSNQFSYSNKDNKFELVQYQNEIKNNLINKIIEDIILHINL